MSWGVTFNPEVFISHVNKAEMKDKIKENEDSMNYAKEKILQLCGATPFFPTAEEFENYLHNVKTEVDGMFEMYTDSLRENVLLGLADDIEDKDIIEG